MPHYKSPDNKVHCIDAVEFERLLPPGSLPITDAEAAAIFDALQTAPDVLAAKAVADADRQAAQDIKADAKFQNLISKTPAQAKNWVDNSFPSLTAPERKDLATIVIAVGVLGRRL